MKNLENSIIEELPQIPYVIDQVGEALKWAKEALSKGEYNKAVKLAYEVTKFVKSISDPNFFRTHIVLASILSEIPDVLKDERFKMFDTASKSTEKDIKAIIVDPEKIEKYGCFKAILLHLVPLAKEDENLFAATLISIKQDLMEIAQGMPKDIAKTPITPQDYITILGYSYVMANIRMANLKLLDKTYQIYNEIEILLNSLKY